MTVTRAQLNRSTLERQLLTARRAITVTDAVRRIVAVQAQEPASPYLALWNRIQGFDAADLDQAFDDRSIVKASLMRITLHAVVADDYSAMHEATTPTLRAARLNDKRFRSTGMTADQADVLVPDLVAFGDRPRNKDEILAELERLLGSPPPDRLWWALRTFAPLVHSPTEPPWSFGRRPWFEAAPDARRRPDRPDALRRLIVRYLEGFGPATVADFAQFTMQKTSVARAAFDELRGDLATLAGPDGVELFDVADAPPLPDGDLSCPPRLMAMWDSTLLAYADRGRVIPEPYRRHVIRRNGDVLPTVLVDGHVSGVWRPVDEGIEITAFEPFANGDWDGLVGEASMLVDFLAHRDPAVYSRFGRWWDQLPPGEVRVLGP